MEGSGVIEGGWCAVEKDEWMNLFMNKLMIFFFLLFHSKEVECDYMFDS